MSTVYLGTKVVGFQNKEKFMPKYRENKIDRKKNQWLCSVSLIFSMKESMVELKSIIGFNLYGHYLK